VDVVFTGVFFVGAAGNGLRVISAVTEARLSLTACLALIAGGFVFLALLVSTAALAMNHRRLKQEAVLKTQAPAAGEEPERWEGYKLEFISGLIGFLLLFLFAALGMTGFIIGSTLFLAAKLNPDFIFSDYFAMGFFLIIGMIVLFMTLGPPWTWRQVGRRSGWGVLFSAVLAPLKKNVIRIALVFLALVFALLFLRALNIHYS
jgi:hypothetical protein